MCAPPCDPPREAANVSLAASINAMALRDAVNTPYILDFMTRTDLLLQGNISARR
jgi:hypothetical protein